MEERKRKTEESKNPS